MSTATGTAVWFPRVVKARYRHTCELCRQRIEKGERCVSERIGAPCDSVTQRWHLHCRELADGCKLEHDCLDRTWKVVHVGGGLYEVWMDQKCVRWCRSWQDVLSFLASVGQPEEDAA